MRKINDYILEEVIGRGAYSTVYKCNKSVNSPSNNKNSQNVQYACKVFKRSKMN